MMAITNQVDRFLGKDIKVCFTPAQQKHLWISIVFIPCRFKEEKGVFSEHLLMQSKAHSSLRPSSSSRLYMRQGEDVNIVAVPHLLTILFQL